MSRAAVPDSSDGIEPLAGPGRRPLDRIREAVPLRATGQLRGTLVVTL